MQTSPWSFAESVCHKTYHELHPSSFLSWSRFLQFCDDYTFHLIIFNLTSGISPLTLDAIVTCLTLISGSVWKHFQSSSFTFQQSSLNADRIWCHSICPLDKPMNAFSSNYSIVPACECPKINIFSPLNPSGQCDTIVLLTFYICNLSTDNLFYRNVLI